MPLTPAIKGQLAKAVNEFKRSKSPDFVLGHAALFNKARSIFARLMPAQQAKHATRKYLAGKVA